MQNIHTYIYNTEYIYTALLNIFYLNIKYKCKNVSNVFQNTTKRLINFFLICILLTSSGDYRDVVSITCPRSKKCDLKFATYSNISVYVYTLY